MKCLLTIILSSLLFASSCEIMPRNTLKDCRQQCDESKKSKACYEFCDCIHKRGEPLDSCLDKYEKTPADKDRLQ
ncbi:MAG TPA: hypothetical protein VM935_17255 [Chitinophagaceae bacterium]|nr:hypothetical protein [Chitinophagaceae bacterium]